MATPNYTSQHSAESVPQIQPQKAGLRSRITGIWQRNHELLRNAGSLLATTGVTSVFGFAYWIVAAREFSQSAVGYGSAAVSAMTLLGTIGMFGLGTVLIGELPRRAGNRGGLVVAALAASAIGSLVLGLGFSLVVLAFGNHFAEIDGTPFRIAVFSFGVALTGATLVFDEATIGLLRGGVQLVRNVAMSVAKMAVLPVAAVVLHDAFGVGILLSWIAGTVLSLIPVVIMFRRSGSKVRHRPNWGLLKSLGKVAMAHNWLNLAITVPPKLIPVLVVVVVSPSANAAFYVAFMIVSLVFMVPTHLSTVLFAIASATPEVIAEKLRFVLRLSIGVGIPVVLVLGLGAHLALSVFGSDYARLATVPLWLMLLQYIPLLPKSQYVAVCRATGQVMKAAVILSTMAAAELAAVIIGGKMGGLDGLCYALLFESVLEGLVTAPKVLNAARGRLKLPSTVAAPATGAAGLASTAAGAATATADETVPMRAVGARYRYSRDAELTALMSIATAVKPDRAAYDRVTGSFRVVTFTPAASLVKSGESGEHLGRHRRLDETMIDMPALKDLTSSGQDTAPAVDDATYELRQQAGVAALMALASRPLQF
jgi:O-antigen/teichoic acid export membrane protein